MLYHPDLSLDAPPFLVKSDTSNIAIGGTLWQQRVDNLVLIDMFSKALSPTQRNYSATERECLGYITTILKFDRFLRSKHFILIGDHEPMLSVFNINIESKNKKLLRWMMQLSDYDFTFEHHSGKSIELKLEDYLSRLADPEPYKSSPDKYLNFISHHDGYSLLNIDNEQVMVIVNKCEVVNDNTFGDRIINNIQLLNGINLPNSFNYELNSEHQHKLCNFINNIHFNLNIEAINRLYELQQDYTFNKLAVQIEEIKCVPDNIKRVFSKYSGYVTAPVLDMDNSGDLSIIYEDTEEINGDYISINAKSIIRTRKQKIEDSIDNEFKPPKSYLIETTESDVFNNTFKENNPLKVIHDFQLKEYKDVIMYIRTRIMITCKIRIYLILNYLMKLKR